MEYNFYVILFPVLAHTNGETSSVFLESFTNISDDLPSCDEIQDIPNMFDKVYYEKLTLIVKKGLYNFNFYKIILKFIHNFRRNIVLVHPRTLCSLVDL